MNEAARDLLKRLGDEGPRLFSGWNAAIFDAYVRTVLPAIAANLSADDPRTFAGIAVMVQQGVGEGHLRGNPSSLPRHFLEWCLCDWLPAALPRQLESERLPMLARIWNLAEGLLREPGWVNAYVMARIGELREDGRPEEFLVEVLRPLLEPAPPVRWEPPYHVTTLSLRASDEDFLPGEMQLATPSVLVVADRRRPVRLGIHLRPGGRSAVLGTFAPTDPIPEEPSTIAVEWADGIARIGPEAVPMPFLAMPYRWSIVPSGYVVACALDSQKLWIVEAAA